MADTDDNMLSDSDPRNNKFDHIMDPDTKKTQAFTKKPSMWDYMKESIQSNAVKAQLAAIRNARARADGGD